jgi:type VI secretion system secreted protein Hcp
LGCCGDGWPRSGKNPPKNAENAFFGRVVLLRIQPVKAIKGFILHPRQQWKRIVTIFGVGLIYILPLLTIPGMAAIYMKIEDIKGEVTTKGYEGWIEVHSAAFSVSREIAEPTGGISDRESGRARFSDFSVTKIADSTTPLLFLESVLGSGKQVDIHFTKAIDAAVQPYYTITLSDVLVSGFSQSSGGDVPMESMSLNFTKIKTSFTPTDPKGGTGTPITRGYDITTGKAF